ncbi:MAG: peptidoglycan DD-metalloendopeptidase family protein [Rhodobacteraceae bacterium]|nr:peptidoglycan DD-metalloendopeptidase family protein [Paracoccaceae bacterium]
MPVTSARIRSLDHSLARRVTRSTALLSVLGLIAACEGPLDYDLRGQIGAFSTSNAAQNATTGRPQADDRGLITYPNYQVAVARRGDTVADIATRIGLPVDEVARFNGVQAEDRLRPGEVLALPRRAPDQLIAGSAANPGSVDIEQLAGSAIEGAATTSPNPGSVTTTRLQPAPSRIDKPQVQAGPEPVRHRVARGETAYTVSRLYQVPVKALAEWNGLGSDFAIREGQYLLIPLKDKSAPAVASPVAASTVTVPGQGTTTPTPPSSTRPLPLETVAAAAEAQALPDIEVPQPSRSSQAAMSYPVQGKIIRAYSKGKNDGIDIAAAAGAPVQAARSGTVAAITADSNKVPIIVIRHDDKLLTVYANVDNIAISKGDRVTRGQTIATLRSGDDAYVHFEVRDGFDSVDPLPYLQ